MKNITLIIILILSLIGNGILLTLWLQKPSPETVIVEVKSRDTIYNNKEIIFDRVKIMEPVIEERIDTLFLKDSMNIGLSDLAVVRTYEDSLFSDSSTLYYNHSVLGYLLNSEYKVKYPEATIIEKEIRTIQGPSWDVHIMAGNIISPDFKSALTLGAFFRHRRMAYHYSYSPQMNSHSASISFRLLQGK